MLTMFRSKKSNIFVWIIIGLLIVGLAGFGISIGGGVGTQEVARVGDQGVSAEEFGRTFDQELRSISSQIGQGIDIEEARQFGIDRSVLARLVNEAALDGQAAELGVSTGDETVRERIMSSPAFRGSDGEFDRETYTFTLERSGLTPGDFEEMLRREAARELIAAGLQSATTMPDTASDTILGHLGERRSFVWVRLDETALNAPVPEPTPEDLVQQYESDPESYTWPETRLLSYAIATPERVAAGTEIPEDMLRAAYDAETERFSTPERRALDRIGFASLENAEAAKTRLEADEVSFEELAAERGLTLEDISQGVVTRTDLSDAAAEAVFAQLGPGIVGPAETALGPSIFRINAVLDARVTSFEEARDELEEEIALSEARALIDADRQAIEDLIAGGATLEEVASETVLELGQIALNDESEDPLALDPGFRALADGAREGEETDAAELADGGVVTVRLEEVQAPQLIPLDEIEDRVGEDWRATQVEAALAALAEDIEARIAGGEALSEIAAELELTVGEAGPLIRNEDVPDLPGGTVAAVFDAEDAGDTVTLSARAEAVVAELLAIEPFDPADPQNAAITENLRGQLRGGAASDMLAAFTAGARNAAGVSVNQTVIDQVLAQFQ